MKKLVLIMLAAVLFISISAQEEIRVKIKDKKFYDSEATAYVVEIPQATYKSVEKAWPKYLKDNLKEKVIIENGQFMIFKKYLPKVSNDSLDINSYIKEYDGHIILSVAFRVNGKYISDDSDEEVHYPASDYVRNFAVEQYQEAVQKELDTEKKKYQEMESKLKILVNANDKSRDAIKQLKRDIVTTKDLITLNEMDQSSKVLQIQAQKELIYKLVNSVGDEQKDAEKNLKQMEKEFTKLQNKKGSMHNKIDNIEAQIRDKERVIEKNEKEQKMLKLERDDQEYLMNKVEKKLDRIK